MMKRVFVLLSLAVGSCGASEIAGAAHGDHIMEAMVKRHPLAHEVNKKILCSLAEKVSCTIDERLGTQEHQLIIGLGQSVAFLLDAIMFIDQAQHRYARRSYKHVAFSGHLLPDEPIDQASYLAYLERIVRQEMRPDTKVVVLDYCLRGAGLASFVDIIKHVYQPHVFYLQEEIKRRIFPLTKDWHHVAANDNEMQLIDTLSTQEDWGDCSDRLVQFYPPDMWQAIKKPELFQPSSYANELLYGLHNFIAKCYTRSNS